MICNNDEIFIFSLIFSDVRHTVPQTDLESVICFLCVSLTHQQRAPPLLSQHDPPSVDSHSSRS